MPNMTHVLHIDVYYRKNKMMSTFIRKVNRDIDTLNCCIDAYNNASDREARIAQLKEIFRFKHYMENKYSDNFLKLCPQFSKKIHIGLFLALQAEFAQYGITSLYGMLDKTPPLPANSFSELLSNMPPEKVSLLINILSIGTFFDKNRLKNLYKPNEKNYAEYQNFLQNNALSYLGGGNSQNFKIQPNDGSPPYILKIENRFGKPKLPEAHLRHHSLKDILTPVMAERKSKCVANGHIATRTILTTEFCVGGDLVNHSYNHDEDDVARVNSALDIYSQMLDILIGFGKDGCAFSDMKNDNWLLDSNGKVRIADTKSFLFCNSDGLIDLDKDKKNTGGAFIETHFISPPELTSTDYLINADKMHAFMFGKDLYEYLTCCSYSTLDGINDAAGLNFDRPIFKTFEGTRLEQLIRKLIRCQPADRISLEEAKCQLIRIGEDLKKEEELKSLRAGGVTLLAELKVLALEANEHQKFSDSINAWIYSVDYMPLDKVKQQLSKISMDLKRANELKPLKIESARLLTKLKSLVLETNEHKPFEDSINIALSSIELIPLDKVAYQLSQISKNLKKAEELNPLKQKGRRLLLELSAHGLGEKDIEMNSFIGRKQIELMNVRDYEKAQQIILDLEMILDQQKIADEVKQVIQKYRNEKGYFTIGMRSKANRIESALCAIPIEQRGKIMDDAYIEGLRVQLAIASPRLFTFFQPVTGNTKSYLTFRNKVDKMEFNNAEPIKASN